MKIDRRHFIKLRGEILDICWSEFAFVIKIKVVITGSFDFEVPAEPSVLDLPNPAWLCSARAAFSSASRSPWLTTACPTGNEPLSSHQTTPQITVGDLETRTRETGDWMAQTTLHILPLWKW